MNFVLKCKGCGQIVNVLDIRQHIITKHAMLFRSKNSVILSFVMIKQT